MESFYHEIRHCASIKRRFDLQAFSDWTARAPSQCLSDTSLYLPSETSTEPGKFRSARMAWLKGVLDDLTDPAIGEHVWM